MTFQPVVPISGYAGWKFLERTKEVQQVTLNNSAQIKRDTQYFRENIGSVTTAEELVSNRRLLSVALGAFGLDDDIGNTFYIKKVLTDGTSDDKSLANRLSDKRYLALSKAFGFGDFAVANTQLSDFPEKIISAFQSKQFEIAVGVENEDLRLALSVERELEEMFEKSLSDDSAWFQIMGTPTLRRVFSEALSMPTSFSSLDIDRQLGEFRKRSEKIFGNGEVSHFADPDNREKLVRRFIIQTEMRSSSSVSTPAAVALALLQT